PVLLDRHFDGPVAGPVLGVDGVVLDRRVEPQAVALLTVVEGALERRGVARGAPPAPAAPPTSRACGGLAGVGLLAILAQRLLASALGLGFGGFQLGCDQR